MGTGCSSGIPWRICGECRGTGNTPIEYYGWKIYCGVQYHAVSTDGQMTRRYDTLEMVKQQIEAGSSIVWTNI